jgi:hypothetical protein
MYLSGYECYAELSNNLNMCMAHKAARGVSTVSFSVTHHEIS